MDDYLLFIEDSSEDILLFEHMLAEQQFQGGTYALYEGEEALTYLNENRSNLPKLIILSLFLHDLDGTEVLEKLKSDPQLALIPVIVWSGVNSQYKKAQCEQLGVDLFVLKPMDIADLQELAKEVIHFWNSLG
ncbi:MAG: response regulator [Bacteroidota bacterium]